MKAASALIAVAVIALAGSLCLGQSGIAPSAAPQASPDAKAARSPIERQIESHERLGLDALVTRNLQLFADLTADDAVFVDAKGPASKAQVLKNVGDFRLTDYSMQDIQFVPISTKSGLITYTITETGISHGKQFTARSYIGSVWTERKGKWVLVFSQETAAR
jgi:hypothetical protein